MLDDRLIMENWFLLLQPDISKFHAELFPILFQFLDTAIAAFQPGVIRGKSGITKIFYALETFCEHLGEGLAPYLAVLMQKLFGAIANTSVSVQPCDFCPGVMDVM